MNRDNTIITIENYNGKRISFTMPIDSSIEIYREAVIADMLEGISDIKIHAKGKNITMEVEDFKNKQKYQSVKDVSTFGSGSIILGECKWKKKLQ